MQNEKTENKTYDLKIEKLIATSPANVFRAIGEGRLFLNCSAAHDTIKVDFKVGGKYHIDFVSYEKSNWGEFLEIIPNQKIVFTWCQDPTPGSKPDTTVTITLKEESGKTKLTLTHVGFTDLELRDAHNGGWNGGLDDLFHEMIDGRLRFSRYFETPVEKLYELCKNPASFLGALGDLSRAKIDFKIGGHYFVPTEKGEIKGEFLEIKPNQTIAFSWLSAPCGEALTRDTKVTLNFDTEEEGGSWLELIHEGLMTESQQKAHRAGWDGLITKMMK